MPKVIKTPHAGIKIWNYTDRVTSDGADASEVNKTDETIISMISCQSITTSKSKSEPAGSFQFILAPTRNWVSVLTPGSWCAILMSSDPIPKEAYQTADVNSLKMFGRIDTVRVEVTVGEDGARQTRYLVSGQDWSQIFNSTFYIDPLISNPSDPNGQFTSFLDQQILKYTLGKNNTPNAFNIPGNLRAILSIFGDTLDVPDKDRVGKPTYKLAIPKAAAIFMGFIGADDTKTKVPDLAKLLKLQTGALSKSSEDSYANTAGEDGFGILNSFTFLGTHSLWSILMDNGNYALNEMYSDIRWKKKDGEDRPQLTLYNRIRPFLFKPASGINPKLGAKFENVVTHKLDDLTIFSVNAGTSWRDKFNFVEIKYDVTGIQNYDNALKINSQAYQKNSRDSPDTNIFDREGFRPLIYTLRQVPLKNKENGDPDYEFLGKETHKWSTQIKEWHGDAHRLLNGQVMMVGSSSYISVGNNILFDASLVGVTHNYNSAASQQKPAFVLGHVETVQHNFGVTADGARTFQTIISFVRGIIVNENKKLIGEGTIDKLSTSLKYDQSQNSTTVLPATPG